VLAIVAPLGACTAWHQTFGGHLEVKAVIDQNLNEGMPLQVDLVIVYDRALLEQLLKYTASAWFAQRQQLLSDFGPQVQSTAWEWVPGAGVALEKVRFHPHARAGVVFANYRTEGDHRQVVQPLRGFLVNAGERGFGVSPGRKK